MLLSYLPPELISLILEGLSLEDISSVSKTSKRLRSVLTSTRSMWLRAADAYLIPVPMNSTLRTMSVEKLAFMADVAVSFTKRYNSERLREISKGTHLLCPLGQARIDFIETHRTMYPVVHLLPGSQWAVVHGVDNINPTMLLSTVDKEVYELETWERLQSCASHELEKHEEIVIATHSTHNVKDSPSQLSVFVVTFMDDSHLLSQGSETMDRFNLDSREDVSFLHGLERRWKLVSPTYTFADEHLIINEMYLAIPNRQGLILFINWRKKTGCWIDPHMEEDPEVQEVDSWTRPYFYLGFHSDSSCPRLVLGTRGDPKEPKQYKIELLKLDADMPRFEEEPLITRFVPTTTVYAFEEDPECGNVFVTGQGSIFEILTPPPRDWKGERIPVSPSRIIDHPDLPIHHKFLRPYGPWSPHRPLRGPNNNSCSMRIYADNRLYICNTRNLDTGAPEWILLETLFGKRSDFSSDDSKSLVKPLAFDPLHGRLIVYYRGIWCLRY
ncbi:hypothetical protein SISSUDRAFT_655762 [Sistotremastrum suecicum HHB10207 ss-3]|uniref:F-box domain-containing protein n=1 Tax=Sistotremastrum suecicum HHB10207 ss-3 TaxID=1314776 RepID=A0A165X312_9AGAM|nr:hypothetical protein SISSUDRAFT_655762 [Sistotremastrum suecicum HHB10207 ss-3]